MNEATLPHDIYELWGYRATTYWWWLAFLMLAFIIAIYLYKRWKRPSTAEKSCEQIDWYQRIMSIKAPHTWSQTPAKEFYFDLSYHLRALIEQRGHFAATDMTAKEIDRALGARDDLLSAADIVAIKKLLLQADRVKFAGEQPEIDKAAADLEAAKSLVQRVFAPSVTQEKLNSESMRLSDGV